MGKPIGKIMGFTDCSIEEQDIINNNIQIHDIFLSSSEGQVVLETSAHAAGEYELTVNGIKDASVNKKVKETP